jgi:hypothetical protein
MDRAARLPALGRGKRYCETHAAPPFGQTSNTSKPGARSTPPSFKNSVSLSLCRKICQRRAVLLASRERRGDACLPLFASCILNRRTRLLTSVRVLGDLDMNRRFVALLDRDRDLALCPLVRERVNVRFE